MIIKKNVPYIQFRETSADTSKNKKSTQQSPVHQRSNINIDLFETYSIIER